MTRYYRGTGGEIFKFREQPPQREWTPVVVIDPEDREAIVRLLDAYSDAYAARKGRPVGDRAMDAGVGDLQAALREMVKPEPPRCTAAISLDGIEFKRCEADQHDESRPHRCGGYTWTGGAS